MRWIAAALLAAMLTVACGGTESMESCWENATNDPESGCHGLSPDAEEACLAIAYDYCLERTGG